MLDRKSFIVLCTIGAVVSLLAASAHAVPLLGEDVSLTKPPAQLTALYSEITEQSKVKNRARLLALIQQLQQVRSTYIGTESALYYFSVMEKAITILQSTAFTDVKLEDSDSTQYGAQAILMTELASPGDIPFEQRCALVGHLLPLPWKKEGDVSREQWIALRQKKTAIVLSTWHDMETLADPKFDPKQRPIFDGTAEPAEQEQMRSNAARYMKQSLIRRLIRDVKWRAEPFLTRSYSMAPYDTDELTRLLKHYQVDTSEEGIRIATAVQKAK